MVAITLSLVATWLFLIWSEFFQKTHCFPLTLTRVPRFSNSEYRNRLGKRPCLWGCCTLFGVLFGEAVGRTLLPAGEGSQQYFILMGNSRPGIDSRFLQGNAVHSACQLAQLLPEKAGLSQVCFSRHASIRTLG